MLSRMLSRRVASSRYPHPDGRHCGALEQESQTTKKNYPGERKSDCTTRQHKSSNQHTMGGGAEQQPDNAESDVQSSDFVTAGGVSTKKKGHQTAFGCMILLKSAS